MDFGLYTAYYEDNQQIFYTTVGRHIYYAAVGADGFGVDDADYVHDEVLVELWRRAGQFFVADHVDDTVHSVHNYTVCRIYCGHVCV